MSVRLSVIIPGYNTPEAWWKRCVDSVLKAIGPEDEIVLVDDGSREGLKVSEFEGLKGLNDLIRIIAKANGGLSSARNAALEIAQGKYVTFVDSDDEIREETFSRCLASLEILKCDVCLYGVEVRWVNEGLVKRDIPDARVYGRILPDDVQDLSKRCLLNYACNKVYRRSFLDKHNLRFDVDGMPCEDIIFNLDCIVAGATWCSVDYVGYVYYRVSGGRTILSSYKPSNVKGLANGAAAWARYCETLSPEEAKLFADRCVLSEQQLQQMEWKNIWMPNTPYSMVARWKWLQQHRLGGVKLFLKTAIFTFLRRHFYILPIRRWHIRKMYPHVEEMGSA